MILLTDVFVIGGPRLDEIEVGPGGKPRKWNFIRIIKAKQLNGPWHQNDPNLPPFNDAMFFEDANSKDIKASFTSDLDDSIWHHKEQYWDETWAEDWEQAKSDDEFEHL